MRTTLEIDDRVLAAARARARARGTSLGAAVSELALRGLERSGADTVPSTDGLGFPTLAGVEGHVITNEMVARYRDDDWDDD